jgi:hypothetical protein
MLISSTNEKFPIALKTEMELKCISATRELLKKIGISSGQFYKSSKYFPALTMKLNLRIPLCVFDLETTGVNISQDRIIEIAVIKVMPSGEVIEKSKSG